VPGQISATLPVPLAAPGTEMTPRVTQLDLSFSKRLMFRGLKIDPKVDIFNALNVDDYFSVRTSTFSPTAQAGVSSGTYNRPGSIIQGRLLRLALVLNW
jgi:hypothetical protein